MQSHKGNKEAETWPGKQDGMGSDRTAVMDGPNLAGQKHGYYGGEEIGDSPVRDRPISRFRPL